MVGLLCLRQGHDHGVIGGETSTELRHSALIKLDTAPDFEDFAANLSFDIDYVLGPMLSKLQVQRYTAKLTETLLVVLFALHLDLPYSNLFAATA